MDHVVVESANEPDRGVPRSLKLFAAGVASLLALACVALSLRLIGRAKYSGEDFLVSDVSCTRSIARAFRKPDL